jgi:hypothetical protein
MSGTSPNGPILPAGKITAANNKADHNSQVLGRPSVFSIIPDYQHSVYIHTKERKHIQDKFLLQSVEGIIQKAAELNLKLLPNIMSSLHNNGGQFIQFTSITNSLSPQAKKFLESNSESPEQYDQQNNTQGPKHVALSGSARFGDRAGVRAANDSEDLIRKLYTFHAIKGDYESMMIMLETPPAHTPPIDPITICQFVHHRMAPPGTPLFVDFTTETVGELPPGLTFFKHVAEVRDSPKFFKILRIEMKNYSHYHKNGNVFNRTSMDIDLFNTKL